MLATHTMKDSLYTCSDRLRERNAPKNAGSKAPIRYTCVAKLNGIAKATLLDLFAIADPDSWAINGKVKAY